MAFITADHIAPKINIFAAIFNAMVRMAENNPRLKQIEALAVLSDAELAAKGIKREDIVRRVMGGSYYL